MKPAFSKFLRIGALSVTMTTPVIAIADGFCHRHNGDLLGSPLTLDFRWPLDLDRPPELLERPETSEALFNNALAPFAPTGGDASSCSGGGITGAIDCGVTSEILNMNTRVAPLTPTEAEAELNRPAEATAPAEDSSEAETAETQPSVSDRQLDRYAYGQIKVVPVFKSGDPMFVKMAVVDTSVDFDVNRIKPEAARRIRKDLSQLGNSMKGWSSTLGTEEVTELSNGESWSSLEMEVIASEPRSPQSNMRVSGPIRLPEACSHLLVLKAEAARLADDLQPARQRLRRLRERLKTETDSERKRKLGVQIQIAENAVRKISNPLETLEKRIRTEEAKHDKAAHDAEIKAIKADPALTKAARTKRLEEAADNLRAVRQYEKQRAAAIQEYQNGLRDYDEKIKTAPDESTRIGYEEARARYKRLYDSWSDQTSGSLAARYRDLNRAFKQNAEDGLGPTDVQSTLNQITEIGVDPEQRIESTEDGMMDRAARIAKSDQTTLGGSASRANDSYQKFRDTAMAFGEERQKVIMTPYDAVKKLKDIADGKTTLKEVVDDQIAFRERYGRYAKGAIVGTGKGLIGLGELGMDGLALEAERQEAILEDALSQATGKDVKIDYFGDRKTKSAANTFAKAGMAMEKFWDSTETRSGVRDDITLKEAWDDPSKVGQMLEETAKAFSDRTASVSEKAAGIIADAGDARLGKIVKGGEKELRVAIEGAGEVVGEFSDAGIAALSALKGVKRLGKAIEGAESATDIAKSGDKLADVTKGGNASDLQKLSEVADAPPPTRPTDAPLAPVETAPASKQPSATPDDRTTTFNRDAPEDATASFTPEAPSEKTATFNADAPSETTKSFSPDPTGEKTATFNADSPADPTTSAMPDASGDRTTTHNRSEPGTFNNDAPLSNQGERVPFNDGAGTRSAETAPPSEPGTRSAETTPPSEPGTRSAETMPPSEPGTRSAETAPPSEPGTRSAETAPPSQPGTRSAETAPPSSVKDAPDDGTFNNAAMFAEDTGPIPGSSVLDEGTVTTPHEFVPNAPEGAAANPNSGALVPEDKKFQISPALQAMLDGRPEGLTKAEKALSEASPFNGNRLPSAAEMTPIKGTAKTADGQPAILKDREGAADLDLQVVRPDGSVENIKVGERLGGGTTSTVYKTRDGSEAVRLAEMTSKDRIPQGPGLDLSRKSRKGFEADQVGRKLLEEAEPKATYFRTAKRSSKDGITRINGKDYFVATEELVTDAKAAFANPLNPKHDWRGAPAASPLDRLTMELAIRDLNAQGIAFTDHKLANLAVVPDLKSPTGRRVVFFDTGGMMPMKGADDAARAGNARQVQRAFDAPRSSDPNAPPSQRFNAYDDSQFWDRIDKRPFGGKNPSGAATASGNARRSEYLKMSEMSAAELRQYVQSSPEMMAQLKAEGRTLDKLVIPGS
ncbi:MAG: hypothetical protein JXQ85_00495 [Cognatishimia sp.]|uniref:hypothetical protein n=1 Tax=Cognatishimia sp. TaxID=2211648 RepID=UPI003B8E622C